MVAKEHNALDPLMHGLVGFLDCVDAHDHFVLSCVRAPWKWGFFYVFRVLFRLPNVEQGYNAVRVAYK